MSNSLNSPTHIQFFDSFADGKTLKIVVTYQPDELGALRFHDNGVPVAEIRASLISEPIPFPFTVS